jgi:hypothetical protein
VTDVQRVEVADVQRIDVTDVQPAEATDVQPGEVTEARRDQATGPDPDVRADAKPQPAKPGVSRIRTVRRRVRVVAGWTGTVVAAALVWLALVAPYRPGQLSVSGLARLPVEGLVLAALALLLPKGWNRVVAVTAGILLALVTIVKILDFGFYTALDRPFDPVSDWSYFGPALGVLRDSAGHRWATIAEFGFGFLMVLVLTCIPLAVVHLNRLVRRHRAQGARVVGALAVVWLVLAALGLRVDAGQPVASTSAAGLAYGEVQLVRNSIHDEAVFQADLRGNDPYRNVPTADLLTGLRGKDVIIAFVESYGQVAVQDSSIAPGVDATLHSATARLTSAGYSSRSAFLTSPTFGGISWLAHSTLQSGLWVDNQNRYDDLMNSQRLTLSDAFHRAGWRTVGDVPSNKGEWPQGRSFYHYDQLYDRTNVGYLGPRFGYGTMPDQFILSRFNQLELQPSPRKPVMAEIDLVSSHIPWTPLPRLVPWDAIGSGSIYDPMIHEGPAKGTVWSSSDSVRAAYGRSVQYSINSLVSFVQNAHDPNLVLVLLGDHQPWTAVSGEGASHEVPISFVASDPNVLSRISSWGWQDGMLPGPDAPVWRMDAFRNRFLSAFDSGRG